LADGTNALMLTATDAWGNVITTNLSVVKSDLTLTMDSIPSDQLWQLWQSKINVTGTVGDPSYSVWVNGVQATVNPDHTWSASNVPVTPGATARFSIVAYAPGEEIPGQPGGN